MRRRSLFPAVLALATLPGCASKPAAPLQPLRRVAVLPVRTREPLGSAGFGAYFGSVAMTGFGGHMASPLRRAVELKKMNEAMQRVREIRFDPAAELSRLLPDALREAGVDAVFVRDPALIASLDTENFGTLPEMTDAILDIELVDAGFNHSSRAGGYYPLMQFAARLRSTNPEGRDLEWFGYYGDWRDGGTDSRWVRVPAAMTYGDESQLSSQAQAIRGGLVALVPRFASLIASDVRRRAAAEPRVG